MSRRTAPAPPRGPRGRRGPHSRWRSPPSSPAAPAPRHVRDDRGLGCLGIRFTVTLGLAVARAVPDRASTSTTALPADLPQGCRDLLDDAVLAQLDGVPLNAPGMGGGIRPDSSRVCVWGEPGLRPPGS
jgi:hypothetical protein